MNLREAIDRYVNAVSSRDYWDNLIADPRTRKEELDNAISACEEAGRLLDALIGMANAAIVLAEFTSHWWFLHKPLPKWDERFDELVKAFEKAKEACNSPAGEGET